MRENSGTRCGSCSLRNTGFFTQRNPDEKLTPLLQPVTARFNGPGVHLDEGADKCQADAEAPLRLPGGTVDLREHLEDSGELVRSNADPGIFNGYQYVLILLANSDPDLAPR